MTVREERSDEGFEALYSDHAELLIAASSEPYSAKDLAEYCESSPPPVYRRVNGLVAQDLLEERLSVDPDGNHSHVSVSNFNAIQFEIENYRFVASPRLKQDVIGRFGEFWQGLEDYSHEDTQHYQ